MRKGLFTGLSVTAALFIMLSVIAAGLTGLLYADTLGPGPMGARVGTIPVWPSQPANMVLASPSNAAGTIMPRLLTPADMPNGAVNLAGPLTVATGTVATGSFNKAGTITSAASGAPTTIAVTFASGGWPNYAFCVVTPSNAAGAAITGGYYISAQSKTGFTLTLGTGTNSAAFNYSCEGV